MEKGLLKQVTQKRATMWQARTDLAQLTKAENIITKVIDKVTKNVDLKDITNSYFDDIIFDVGRHIYECKNDEVSTPNQKSPFAKFVANKKKEEQNQLLISELRKVIDILNDHRNSWYKSKSSDQQLIKKLTDLKYTIKERKVIERTTARGGVAQVISDLKATPDNLNFYEAHQRLSKIKSTISDLRASSNPDNNLVDVLIKHQRLMESGMDEAASRLSPTLQKEYADVTAYYKKGRQVVTAEWLKAAMKNNDPAKIGAMLTQDGLSEGLIQIKQLRKAASDFKKDLPKPPKGSSQREINEYNEMLKGLDVDPLEGIRRGFLDEMLRTSPDDAIGSAQQFANKLKQPRFRETFNELFKGTGVPSKMDEMLENLTILSRTDKAQQGFALTLAGAEQKALSEPKIGIIFKSALPAFLAGLKIRPSSIDKMISLQKAAIAAEKGGVDISQQLLLSLEKLTRRGNVAGTVLSVRQQQKPPTQEYSR